MAQTSGFFEAEWDDELYNEETQSLGDWDRKYLAEEFARYFSNFVSTGVMNDPVNQLKVTAGTGMKVIVSSGFAFINGYWFYNSEQLELDVPLNETPSTRTDSVRIRWNATYRTIECIYVAGSITNVRTDVYYDLQLAQVSVGAGASIISDANITDVRGNKDLCGLITLVHAEDIGDIEDLTTVSKTNIVSAINSIITMIGNMASLKSADTRDLVRAINSIQWLDVVSKPFDSVDYDDFDVVDSGTTYEGRMLTKLKIKPKVISWNDISSKPFSTLNASDFNVVSGELKISDVLKMFNAIDAETLSIETLGTVKKLVVNHSQDDFVISNRQFVFSNLQCRINNDKITANSLADVYFNSESINYAQKAKISVETYNGYLILTALVEPTGSIYGTIRIRVV